ncbi:MAG: hypothetical protein FVQ82_01860 [Planctomycetes bacterium]|nr:hypothetical protein [Planctomycetota bacterium]
MKTEKVLITVKTYPTLSTKYGELVCTAGVREDGSWVRIYPMPFRRLKDYFQFEKYRWIELPLERNTKDRRPESFRPKDLTAIKTIGHMDTSDKWQERRRFILGQVKCFDSIEELICLAKEKNELSFALFKPKELVDFYWEEDSREWDKKKRAKVIADLKQGQLFEQEEFDEDFKLARKLPYIFRYKFIDSKGKSCDLSIRDWEVGALFWNCLRSSGNEQEALEKVKQKYWDDFALMKDMYFYLGTTQQFHSMGRNPFIIIGTFTPPVDKQLMLDF